MSFHASASVRPPVPPPLPSGAPGRPGGGVPPRPRTIAQAFSLPLAVLMAIKQPEQRHKAMVYDENKDHGSSSQGGTGTPRNPCGWGGIPGEEWPKIGHILTKTGRFWGGEQ